MRNPTFFFSFLFTIILIFLISEKLAEAIRKFSSLKNELIIPKGPPGKKSDSRSTVPLYPFHDRPHIPARKLQDLKLAFTEFYLSLVLLQNYQSLNFTGFRKILKKHDKVSYQHMPNLIIIKMFSFRLCMNEYLK